MPPLSLVLGGAYAGAEKYSTLLIEVVYLQYPKSLRNPRMARPRRMGWASDANGGGIESGRATQLTTEQTAFCD